MSQEDLQNFVNQKTVEKRIPISCQFDITHYCNLNCLHCYMVTEDRHELKTSEIIGTIDQLADLGTLYLGLSGGEIFTRDDFFEIAGYARDLHFALNISTNGTLIDTEMADNLSALCPNRVSLSVYSMNPKIHDKITGVLGSLEKTIKAAKMLKNRNISLRIVNIIMKQNVKEYHHVYELAKKLDAEFQVDPQIIPKTDGSIEPLSCQINDNDLYEILADPLLNMNLRNEAATETYYNTIFDDLPCTAAHNSFYISPYGDIFPCVQFPLLCGNLKENSLHEIWYNSPNMSKASKLKMSDLPVCSKCESIDYCRYCPGLSVLEEGDVMTPPSRCCTEAELMSKLRR